MPSPDSRSLTELAFLAREGDASAASEVFERAYAELRTIAKQVFGRERRGHTLQPTAVVNEAWFKLWREGRLHVPEGNRDAFFGAAKNAMQQILADHAKHRDAKKRGGSKGRSRIDERELEGELLSSRVVALYGAIKELCSEKPRWGHVAEMKAKGHTNKEVASELGISVGTVKSDWSSACAWLKKKLASYAPSLAAP